MYGRGHNVHVSAVVWRPVAGGQQGLGSNRRSSLATGKHGLLGCGARCPARYRAPRVGLRAQRLRDGALAQAGPENGLGPTTRVCASARAWARGRTGARGGLGVSNLLRGRLCRGRRSGQFACRDLSRSHASHCLRCARRRSLELRDSRGPAGSRGEGQQRGRRAVGRVTDGLEGFVGGSAWGNAWRNACGWRELRCSRARAPS